VKIHVKKSIGYVLGAGLTGSVGLMVGCSSGSFCQTCNPSPTADVQVDAQYVNAVTTVGTALNVTPARYGMNITSAAGSTGTLPPGMALNADGSITGTPTQAGVYPLQIQLYSGSTRIVRPVVITVNPLGTDPINAQYQDGDTTAGTSLSVSPTVLSGGPASSATLLQGTLPPGMSLNPSTGVITGTPTAVGVYPLAVDLVNDAGAHVVVPVTITVGAAGVKPLTANIPDATTPVNSALTIHPVVVDGGPITGSTLVSGSIPVGMALNPDGSITGTPTAPGTYVAQIALRNAGGALTTKTVTITVNAATASLLSVDYSDAVTSVGDTVAVNPAVLSGGPITGAKLLSGSLPPGLLLGSDGTITGTAQASGLYSLEVQLNNASGGTTVVPLSITVNQTALGLGYSNQTFALGTAISTQSPVLSNAASGLSTAYAVTSGSLPGGLSLNASSGVITGTPSAAGVFPFTVTATNGVRTAAANVIYTVSPAAALSVAYADQSFAQGTLIADQSPVLANATPGISTTYALSSGSLPDGLSLNANTGIISGTPITAGVFSFGVTATNGVRTAASSATYIVAASSALGLSYGNNTFVQGTAITAQAPVLSNPTPGLATTYALASGSLPDGLSLDPTTGVITGTPTTPGVVTFTLRATNGTRTADSVVTYTIAAATSLLVSYGDSTFPQGAAITSQSATLSNATPGVPTTYALSSGSLPNGLSLNASTGSIEGTPSVAGVFAFAITATNGTRTAVSTQTYTVTPAASLGLVYATNLIFPQGTLISNQTPSLTNATPGLATTYALKSGSLPNGLTLNPSTGVISGNPTTAGLFSFEIEATNGTRKATSTETYTVTPVAALGLSYANNIFAQNTLISNQSPALSNATPGVSTTYALVLGNLPNGLSLAADTGIISGTPTTPGVFDFSIKATNGTRSATSAQTYTVTPAAALTVNYANGTFTQGTVITQQNPVLANPTPGVSTTYAVTTGSLPAGLTLNTSTGAITGTPTGTGSTFTITATNGTRTATSSPTYTVNEAIPLTLGYTTPTTYTVGYPISSNLPHPTGGTPTHYVSTALPAGLTLDANTGEIKGTPTTAGGPTSVTVTGNNGAGSAQQVISITVTAAPTASLASNPASVPVGQSSSLTVLFSGSANGTALLTGDGISTPMTVTSGTSIPTGIVNVAGTIRNYQLQVTDAQGHMVSSNASVQWIAAPSDLWVVTIPPTPGGTYTPDAGSQLNGQITITTPDMGQSTCGDVILSVNKEASLPGTVPTGVKNYSTTFNIASSKGYPFRVPITVTLAYDPALSSPSLDANDLPMAFYWDPSYSQWVSTGIKSVNTTNHTVTFTTLLPGRYVVMGIHALTPTTQTLNPTFASLTDDWRQNNPSIYDLPGGASLGMGSFASWFAPFRKSTNGNVGLYNTFPTLTDAKAQALISRLANGTMDSWSQLWEQKNYSLTPKQTGQALITALKATGQPQIFLMGDARPAVNTSLATAVYGYNSTTGKFNVMDPNYPGNALTITWNSSTGAFSAYDRSAGYAPALAQYAFEGQTSVHRLADYDRVFTGAADGFPAQTFATVAVDHVAGTAVTDITQTQLVNSSANVVISGTVTNGDESANTIFWSQNGSAPRTAVSLTPVDATHSSFTFEIPALADPYGTTVALETSANACDPTFSHSGFQKFAIKQTGLSPWFGNACFENGLADPAPWVLEQGSNNSIAYPASPTFSSTTGQMAGYGITWSAGSSDSALVTSPSHAADTNVPGIASVLDGNHSFRVNDPTNGAHISRMYQTITVPSTVARPKLTFYWAAAMQSAGHVPSQLPYVDILVQDADNSYEILYSVHHYPPSTVSGTTYTDGYPGWISGTGSGATQWYGINWQQVNLNLGSGRGGHHLLITVMAADCTQGGHGGYAYIDSVGCQ